MMVASESSAIPSVLPIFSCKFMTRAHDCTGWCQVKIHPEWVKLPSAVSSSSWHELKPKGGSPGASPREPSAGVCLPKLALRAQLRPTTTVEPECFSKVEGAGLRDSPSPAHRLADSGFFRSHNISAVLATMTTSWVDVILSQGHVSSGQLQTVSAGLWRGGVNTRLLEWSHCLSHLCTWGPKDTQAGGGSGGVLGLLPCEWAQHTQPSRLASVHPGSTLLLGAGLLSYFSVVWPRASFCLCSGTCLIRNTC